jgi:predicted ferric reductase
MIRSNKYLRKWIPIDDHIDFHKFVGRFIAVLVIFHTVAHMINFGRRTGELQIERISFS